MYIALAEGKSHEREITAASHGGVDRERVNEVLNSSRPFPFFLCFLVFFLCCVLVQHRLLIGEKDPP